MLAFTKAQAYGNDFLLVEATAVSGVSDLPGLARTLCDRHRGIGADGLVIIDETPQGARTSLFNCDGSRAEVSGNGVRCVGAWLVHRRSLEAGASLTVDTAAGPKGLAVLERQGMAVRIRAAMGQPEQLRRMSLDVAGERVEAVVLRVGNPQCVVFDALTADRLQVIGGGLAVHAAFPEGTNVELAQVEAPNRVRILIWERGVGPTEASGTGACAAAVAAAAFGGASRAVDVISPGGTQQVEWNDDGIWLSGWANLVAWGQAACEMLQFKT